MECGGLPPPGPNQTCWQGVALREWRVGGPLFEESLPDSRNAPLSRQPYTTPINLGYPIDSEWPIEMGRSVAKGTFSTLPNWNCARIAEKVLAVSPKGKYMASHAGQVSETRDERIRKPETQALIVRGLS